MFHQPRHNIVGVWENLQLAYGSDLAPWLTSHHFLYDFDKLGGRKQGVTPLRHRCGPRMIGKSANLHVVLVDADDSFHHADWDLGFFKHAALLDVQFQVATEGVRSNARLCQPRGITSN